MKKLLTEHLAPEIYTLKQACEYLRIHRSTGYRMIRMGQLRTIHVGRVHRVTSLELERIAAQNAIYTPPKG